LFVIGKIRTTTFSIITNLPGEHLKDEDAESPPVYCFSVAFTLDDLGGKVLGCSTEGPRSVLDLFGKPKISNLDMAVPVEQEVFRFEVTVDDVPTVFETTR